jgi:redox-sensitive bicupin YhaK (pirin superfamily)
MSGPVTDAETFVDDDSVGEEGITTPVQVVTSRTSDVGGKAVRRALPRRERRTIGAWCFADHFGPEPVSPANAMMVGPHPHIGLQTVTWLLEGEVVHTDSLGSEQPIRAGQLNLMTAGRGVAHAEDGRDHASGVLHGVQLWVALPDATRNGPPAFEHHGDLPEVDLGGGRATVLVGTAAGANSPARHDTPLIGLDVVIDRSVEIGIDPTFEHGVLVLDGSARVDGATVSADQLAYLPPGRSAIDITASSGARALLLGGEPFGEHISMWWNFVARTKAEMTEALDDWIGQSGRFGEVESTLEAMPAPRPPWLG